MDPEVQAILARASKRKHLKQREEKKWNSELHILDRALEVQHHEIEHREQKATAGRLGADKSTNRSSLQHAESPATNQSLQLFAQVNVYLGNGNFFARWWPSLNQAKATMRKRHVHACTRPHV